MRYLLHLIVYSHHKNFRVHANLSVSAWYNGEVAIGLWGHAVQVVVITAY